jgi:hypothetical protein
MLSDDNYKEILLLNKEILLSKFDINSITKAYLD